MAFVSMYDAAEARRILDRPGSAPIVTTDEYGREVRREKVDAAAPGNKRGVLETTWYYAPGDRLQGHRCECLFTEVE